MSIVHFVGAGPGDVELIILWVSEYYSDKGQSSC